MTAHSWVMVSDTYDVVQCALCGVIRITIHHHIQGTVTRYSRPNANINHCNVWRKDEPFCERIKSIYPEESAS